MIISRNLSPHPVHALSATFCRHCLRPRRTCQERQWEQRSRWWRGRTLPSSRPTHTHIRPRSNDKSVIPMNIANRESAIIIYEHLQNNMGKTCDMLVSMCEGWFWFLMYISITQFICDLLRRQSITSMMMVLSFNQMELICIRAPMGGWRHGRNAVRVCDTMRRWPSTEAFVSWPHIIKYY